MVSKAKAKTKPKASSDKDQSTSNPKPVVLRVGPVDYEVHLSSGWLESRGDRCYGLADMDGCRIYVSDALPIRKRIATFWHEFMHAVISECACGGTVSKFGTEELCDLIGIGMSDLDASAFNRIHELLSQDRGAGTFIPVND